MSKTEIPILKGAHDSEIETQRKAREATNKEVMRVYEIAEDKNNREKTKIWRDQEKRSGQKSQIHPLIGPRR